jgi:hypothetical protein
MTTEVLALALTAAAQSTFGQGRIFYVKTATAPLSIIAESNSKSGKVRKFTNIFAGFKFKADAGDGWDRLRVTSATSQNIELIIGDDDVEVSNAVSVTGAVTTVASPSSSIASAADIAVATATATTIAANLARRAIIVGSLSTNTGSVRVQLVAAGASHGLELQPGTWETFPTTAALDVRNDSGVTCTIWTFEVLP